MRTKDFVAKYFAQHIEKLCSGLATSTIAVSFASTSNASACASVEVVLGYPLRLSGARQVAAGVAAILDRSLSVPQPAGSLPRGAHCFCLTREAAWPEKGI